MQREPSQEELLEAYSALDLPPGTPLDKVMEEWRFLAGKLHPDQAKNEKDRARSEAKLKRLNHAKDILTAHHKGNNHSASGSCACNSTRQNINTAGADGANAQTADQEKDASTP